LGAAGNLQELAPEYLVRAVDTILLTAEDEDTRAKSANVLSKLTKSTLNTENFETLINNENNSMTNRSVDNTSNDTGLEYFTTKHGQKIGITDEILIKCKDGIDCTELLSRFNLEGVSKITDTIFLVKISDTNDMFSLSRELFETGDVEFAHPNFVKERRLR